MKKLILYLLSIVVLVLVFIYFNLIVDIASSAIKEINKSLKIDIKNKKILEDFVVKIIIVALVSIFTLFGKYLIAIRKRFTLWNFYDFKNILIFTSSYSVEDSETSQKDRRAIGLEQVRSIALILLSLKNSYSNITEESIKLASKVDDNIEKDLILIGGPQNNSASKHLISELNKKSILNQDDYCFKLLMNINKEFKAEASDDMDYGLIMRISNPFQNDKRSCIHYFAGNKSYGTYASVKYFVKMRDWKVILYNVFDIDYVIVVRYNLVENHIPTGIKRILINRIE